MNFVLSIDLDNAAFDSFDAAEQCRAADAVAKCLRRVAISLDRVGNVEFGDTGSIMDSGGNKVGTWEVRGQTVEQRHARR